MSQRHVFSDSLCMQSTVKRVCLRGSYGAEKAGMRGWLKQTSIVRFSRCTRLETDGDDVEWHKLDFLTPLQMVVCLCVC
jgi:hypothetical protein